MSRSSIAENPRSHEVIDPEQDKAQYDRFHFAPAVRQGDLIICSGQIGAGPDGVPDTAEEEFHNAWNAVGRVLKEAGVSYNQFIEDTTFHVNVHDHLGQFMKVRDEFLSEPWTAIGTTESWRFRGLGRRYGWWRVTKR